MNAPQDLNRLYSDVSNSISGALADISALNVEHKDGKREIGNITEKLRAIQSQFDTELHQLSTHAEWDTFTLAFFGETNAGKSTIIESLRILFKEESRQALLKQNGDDLEKFKQALEAHLENVRNGIYALHNEYTNELANILKRISSLASILQREVQERNAIAKVESDERLRLEQHEAEKRLALQQQEAQSRLALQQQEAEHRKQVLEQESSERLIAEKKESEQRLQVVQAHALSRFKARVAMFTIGGAVSGASVAVALMKLTGI